MKQKQKYNNKVARSRFGHFLVAITFSVVSLSFLPSYTEHAPTVILNKGETWCRMLQVLQMVAMVIGVHTSALHHGSPHIRLVRENKVYQWQLQSMHGTVDARYTCISFE